MQSDAIPCSVSYAVDAVPLLMKFWDNLNPGAGFRYWGEEMVPLLILARRRCSNSLIA
jgi:hypothetical protein